MSTQSNVTSFRTDRNNNPTAFTTDIAKEAGLVLGTDYEQGDSFADGAKLYYTAKILGDPIALTVKVLNKIGFFTGNGVGPRWTYITLEYSLWMSLEDSQKKFIISIMYLAEGGTAMKGLFS